MRTLRRRDRLALTAPPVLLRVVLGVTFLWMGLGKIFGEIEVQPEKAAVLANWGVIKPPASGGATPTGPTHPLPPPVTTPQIPPASPTPPAPSPAPVPEKPATPPSTPPAEPSGKPPEPAPATPPAPSPPPPSPPPGAYLSLPLAAPAMLAQAGVQPEPPAPDAPKPSAPAPVPPTTHRLSAPAAGPAKSSPAQPRYTAADFPEPVKVARMYGLALVLHYSAHPPPPASAEAPPARAVWPAALADGTWPWWSAWAVVFMQAGGGALLLAGLLTRAAALGVAATMLGAIWLGQIGPAIQSGHAFLWFLPGTPIFESSEWRDLFWHVLLMTCAVTIALSGPGMVAVDSALFRRVKSAEDDD